MNYKLAEKACTLTVRGRFLTELGRLEKPFNQSSRNRSLCFNHLKLTFIS